MQKSAFFLLRFFYFLPTLFLSFSSACAHPTPPQTWVCSISVRWCLVCWCVVPIPHEIELHFIGSVDRSSLINNVHRSICRDQTGRRISWLSRKVWAFLKVLQCAVCAVYCSRQLYTFSEGEEKKGKEIDFGPKMSRKRIFRPFFALHASGEFLRCDDDVIFHIFFCSARVHN